MNGAITSVDTLTAYWQQRLAADLPTQGDGVRRGVLLWLLGENSQRLDQLTPTDFQIVRQSLEYRYQILRSRYWDVPPNTAYQRLIKRLSSLFLVRQKISTWISLSRDRQRTVTDVLQEVIQEMLQNDRQLRQQVTWIGHCTTQARLRNWLMVATLEEYCLRPIRNQPLLVYRFVNYLRRSQRGGMTQVPAKDLVCLVSDETTTGDADNPLSLLDGEAISRYQLEQQTEEAYLLREQVKQDFENYLREALGQGAVDWLRLHLQGYTQEEIAQRLNLSVKESYRLREKIRYHAVRVYTLKENPDLVFAWLKTSPQEHNLGLSSQQWSQFLESCSPQQRKILEQIKAGAKPEEIAQSMALRPRQVAMEWANLYLTAQAIRVEAAEA